MTNEECLQYDTVKETKTRLDILASGYLKTKQVAFLMLGFLILIEYSQLVSLKAHKEELQALQLY